MKKLIILISSCFLPLFAAAESTCETRVDAHQRATTKQRVAYCLTPDAVAADDTYANLVFSGVSEHPQPAAQPVDTTGARAKEGQFKPERVIVSRTYVETDQFPQVFKDDASEIVQVDYVPVPVERQMADEVSAQGSVPAGPALAESAPVTSAPVVEQDTIVYVSSPSVPVRGSTKPAVTVSTAKPVQETIVPAPVEHFMADEVDNQGNLILQTGVTETKGGIAARQTKPARQLTATTAQPAPATEPNPYSYKQEDLTQSNTEVSVSTQSYAPAAELSAETKTQTGAVSTEEQKVTETQNEIPVGTQSYAPATSN